MVDTGLAQSLIIELHSTLVVTSSWKHFGFASRWMIELLRIFQSLRRPQGDESLKPSIRNSKTQTIQPRSLHSRRSVAVMDLVRWQTKARLGMMMMARQHMVMEAMTPQPVTEHLLPRALALDLPVLLFLVAMVMSLS